MTDGSKKLMSNRVKVLESLENFLILTVDLEAFGGLPNLPFLEE